MCLQWIAGWVLSLRWPAGHDGDSCLGALWLRRDPRMYYFRALLFFDVGLFCGMVARFFCGVVALFFALLMKARIVFDERCACKHVSFGLGRALVDYGCTYVTPGEGCGYGKAVGGFFVNLFGSECTDVTPGVGCDGYAVDVVFEFFESFEELFEFFVFFELFEFFELEFERECLREQHLGDAGGRGGRSAQRDLRRNQGDVAICGVATGRPGGFLRLWRRFRWARGAGTSLLASRDFTGAKLADGWALLGGAVTSPTSSTCSAWSSSACRGSRALVSPSELSHLGAPS